MKKVKYGILVIVSALCLFLVKDAGAFTINVDGRLNEWGVTPDIYGSSDWDPNPGILSSVEDTPPLQDRVWPGYGGQQFDVEAMYVTSDSSNLYFAIVTGFPPGGARTYFAGDIAFNFGINTTWDYGISAITRNGFIQGNLYENTTWNNGLWGWYDPLSDPTYMNTGTATPGQGGSLIYTNDFYAGNHYVIEGYMPTENFGAYWGQDFRMHWAMSCGNDYLNVDYTPVPEPATMTLLGLGLLGVAGLRRRKIRV